MAFAVRNFDHAETLGEKLRTMRRNLNFSLEMMAKKTRVQRKYLEAFERGSYHKLPETIYAKNFLQTYVRALGGDVTYFLERFEEERGTCDLIENMRLPRQKVRARHFFAAHRLFKAGMALVLFASLAGYIGFQVNTLLRPPQIVLFEPSDGLSTDQAILTVRGTTDREAEIFVNGNKVLPGPDGAFETQITLERGLNVISVEGATRHSRKAVVYRRIVLEQEEPRRLGSLSTARTLE
jgi:transcriptional regulator with XRE-family HTH domain